MQRFDTDVDDATEFVLDHTSNTQTTEGHYKFNSCMMKGMGICPKEANGHQKQQSSLNPGNTESVKLSVKKHMAILRKQYLCHPSTHI